MKDDQARLTVAIGPPQGCLAPLRSLIDRCQRYAADWGYDHPRFVLLGNMIGHGPASAGVVAFLRQFELEHDVVVLRGAHEQAMIDTVLGSDDGTRWVGAADVIASYGLKRFDDPELPSNETIRTIINHIRTDARLIEDAEWLSGLPGTFEEDSRAFVHNQRQDLVLAKQDQKNLLASRKSFPMHDDTVGKLIVQGCNVSHKARQPEETPNLINLDTNAWWSGVLVAGVFKHTQRAPIILLDQNFEPPEV